MRVIVFSDVHGNLPAFETMLEDAGDCDQYICLGDLVNYGPWSNECVDLALSLPSCRYIMGNHETAFLQGHYEGGTALVKTFFDLCIEGFDRKKEIGTFQHSLEDFGYSFCHTIGERSIYPDTNISLDRNYMIGHSHHQFIYNNNGFTLYNTGSVGQNRKYINVVNYLVMDTKKGNVELLSAAYDVDSFIAELKVRNYPTECINYYELKERA